MKKIIIAAIIAAALFLGVFIGESSVIYNAEIYRNNDGIVLSYHGQEHIYEKEGNYAEDH